jgi:hypothetical protein
MSKTNDSEHLAEQTERSAAKHSDREADTAPILDKNENNAQARQQERENLRVLRFTKDSNNSFTIGMPDGTSISDKRPLGKSETASTNQEGIVPQETNEKRKNEGRTTPAEFAIKTESIATVGSTVPELVQSYLQQLSGSKPEHQASGIFTKSAQEGKEAPDLVHHVEHSAFNHHEQHHLSVLEQVLAKEHELTRKYGVHFAKPGESLGNRQMLDGTNGAAIHSREPSLAELAAIEKALQNAGPEIETGKNGGKLTFAFPDQQRHDGLPADADFQPHLKHGQTIEIFPEGANKSVTDQSALVYELRHEFSHNTMYKIDGLGVACPDEIANKIGFTESNDPVNKLQRGPDGRLWRHDPGDDAKHFWTEVDNHGVPKLNKHGHITQKRFEEVKLQNTSLIEVNGTGGKVHYFHHTIGDTGTQYWIRCDKDGQMLDAAGNPVTGKAAAEQLSNADMKNAARVKPPTDYFDDASEAAAEAITRFRFDETKRKDLLHQSPEYYQMAKAEDQRELNKHYGTHRTWVNGEATDTPNVIRLPNGEIVKNTPSAQAAVDNFEKTP